jgi:hypothetical protein
MQIGMLWFDDSTAALGDKVEQAVAYYTKKYGHGPTHCLINPKTLNGGKGSISGVLVQAATNVMPDHYWIGTDESIEAIRQKANQVV